MRLVAAGIDANGNEVEDTDYIWSAPHPSVVTVDGILSILTFRSVVESHLHADIHAQTGRQREMSTQGGPP